jgi:hypothetical protein
LGLLPHFTKENQLQYLLVAPLTVHCCRWVDKTTALTGLAIGRDIGSKLKPTLRTKQCVWIGWRTALRTLTDPKLSSTSFAESRINII